MAQAQESLSNGLDEVWERCFVNGEVGYDEICPIWVCVLDGSSGRESG